MFTDIALLRAALVMAKGYSPNYNVDVRAADYHHNKDIMEN